MRLEFSARARRDLRATQEWISRDNPVRAISFVDELEKDCRALLDYPEAFPIAYRDSRRVLRKRVHGAYLILYEALRDRIVIATVVHGARMDWSN